MILICDSHPVQYKAPVYRELNRRNPGVFEVLYASDCSVRGHQDTGFGRAVAWDTPLLAGYTYEIAGREHGVPLKGFFSLSGWGLFRRFRQRRPDAVMLSQLLYLWDVHALLAAWLLRIPVSIRIETNDVAVRRTRLRQVLRGLVWRAAYRLCDRAFYIGKLNRAHLRAHGFADDQLDHAPYCVVADWAAISEQEKSARRAAIRHTLGLRPDEWCVAFVGKLIPKKDPLLLLDALGHLPPGVRTRVRLLYVGTGQLEQELREQAAGIAPTTLFAGFINQSQLPDYYWAADTVVLPSRRQGETWGLVINEALHAGCSVVMSEAVGCQAEFGHLERARVIPEHDATALAQAIADLSRSERSFDWATEFMQRYSVQAAARGIADTLVPRHAEAPLI